MDFAKITDIKFYKMLDDNVVSVSFVYANSFRFCNIRLNLSDPSRYFLMLPRDRITEYYYFFHTNYEDLCKFFVAEREKQNQE